MHFRAAVKKISLLALVSLAGCGAITHRNEIADAATDSGKQVSDRVIQAREEDQKRTAPVREIDAVWLGAKTVKVAREAELPAIFNQPTTFQFPDRPALNVTADRLAKITGLPVRVTPDALVPIEQFVAQRMATAGGAQTALQGRPPVAMPSPAGPIGQYAPSMATLGSGTIPAVSSRPLIIDLANPFNGTLAELLDQLSAKYGVGWDYKDGAVTISRIVTRTYQVASLMDASETSTAVKKTADTGNSTASSGTTGSNGSANSTSDVSSKVTSKTDVGAALEKALSGIVTPNVGKFSISPSGIVTVTDTRDIQEQVAEMVDAENRSYGRQVKLRVQVIQVDTSVKDDNGVDWAWLINSATKWNVDFFAPTGLPGGSTGFGQLGVIRNGGNSKTDAFLRALSQVGKTTIRKDETYQTLNNRQLSIANTDNFIYPARSSPGSSSGNSSTVTPGIDPGQLTTGTFLNMRPSIQPNGSVIVQFSLDSSLRGEVTTFESNGAKLQYPQSNGNQQQQTISAVSGTTAVIAASIGSQQQGSDRSLDSKLSPLLGGGMSSSTTRRFVLILLTPTIVEGVM